MKSLVTKAVIKVIVAILLCSLLNAAVASLAPHISNDVAMGQLENDDMSFIAMETWNRIVDAVFWVQAGIVGVCGGSVIFDTYKYFKNRKENENHENC